MQILYYEKENSIMSKVIDRKRDYNEKRIAKRNPCEKKCTVEAGALCEKRRNHE